MVHACTVIFMLSYSSDGLEGMPQWHVVALVSVPIIDEGIVRYGRWS